ncbi:hypothetical protein GCM10025787_38760 [Saccharopolyspora rosea]
MRGATEPARAPNRPIAALGLTTCDPRLRCPSTPLNLVFAGRSDIREPTPNFPETFQVRTRGAAAAPRVAADLEPGR